MLAFTQYVHERLHSEWDRLFSGPMTVVMELEDGSTLTRYPVHLAHKTEAYGESWVAPGVMFEVPRNKQGKRVLRVVVYDDDWTALLVTEQVIVLTAPEVVLHDIGVRRGI